MPSSLLFVHQGTTKTAKSASIHKDIYKNGSMAFCVQAAGSPNWADITKKKGTQTKRPFMGRYTYSILLMQNCARSEEYYSSKDADYQANVGRCSSRMVTNSQRALS